MVRIYQKAEESQIKRVENELDLRNVYLLGIGNDNNYVIVRKRLEALSSIYRVFKDMSIIEDDSGPIYLSSGTEIYQRCEEGEDIVIERLENDLRLQGIYVFGIDKYEKIVIVHKGRKTKAVYIRIFGYGIEIRYDELGREREVNVCS